MVPGLCLNGKCISLPGGYRCMCNVGYKLTMDGKRCLGKVSFSFSLTNKRSFKYWPVMAAKGFVCMSFECKMSSEFFCFSKEAS